MKLWQLVQLTVICRNEEINPFDQIAFRAGLDQLAGRILPPGLMFDTPGLESM